MSIKFFIPGPRQSFYQRASLRYRATIPLSKMRSSDGIINDFEQLQSNDKLIISCKTITDEIVEKIKEKNINFYYDICEFVEHKKNKKLHHYFIKNADKVIVSTRALKDLIIQKYKVEPLVIPDTTETKRKLPKFKKTKNRKIIKILFFGTRWHFMAVEWKKILNSLKQKNSNFQLNAVTNLSKEEKNKFLPQMKDLIEENHLRLFDWSSETQRKLLDDCDIVFLPNYINRSGGLKLKFKTENRIVDALNAGKIILSNEGIDSYYPFKPYIQWISNYNISAKFRARFSKPLDWIPRRISDRVYRFLFFKKNIRLTKLIKGYLFTYEELQIPPDILPNVYAENLLNIMENAELMFQKILSAQKIIDRKYLPEVVAKKWLALDP